MLLLKAIYRIIDHLELTYEAERLPLPHNAQEELIKAAEENREYF